MSDQFPARQRRPLPTQARGEPGHQPGSGIRDLDPPPLPEELLQLHRARVLDPATAVRAPGERNLPLRPTVYIGDEMLVPAPALSGRLGELLGDSARRYGLRAVPDEISVRRAGLLRERGRAAPAIRVWLEPADGPAEADAWPVLVAFRHAAAREGLTKEAREVGLNHLMMASLPFMTGGPVVVGNLPFMTGGPAEYGQPGSGGRMPVAWIGRPPQRNAALGTRRPVVAVLDTGVGEHPWLRVAPEPDPIVTKNLDLDGEPIGHTDADTDPEATGDIRGPLDGALDTHSGHGTFIAGLIHQLCPDADILAVRIMTSDGLAHEDDVLWALAALRERLARAQAGRPGGGPLDVLVLSLGYYHEAPEDKDYDVKLLAELTELGAMGVAVVAAAGNNATIRPMYPAAFTPHAGGYVETPDANIVPVLSVGSLNPDESVALFSNSGRWVTAWDTGAAVVSTFPRTFNGGAAASVETADPSGQVRRTIDPDNYSGGFGTWSGTSFAAPILAGRLAQHLIDGPSRRGPAPDLDDRGANAAVARGWAAVEALTDRLRR